MPAGLTVFSRTWNVLNYAVHEPDEWTTRQIAEDLDEKVHVMTNVVIILKRKGYLKTGRDIGKAKALVATASGVDALHGANKCRSAHM